MVSPRRARSAQAKREVRALGGSILYAADRYGYFSARIPTSQGDRPRGRQRPRRGPGRGRPARGPHSARTTTTDGGDRPTQRPPPAAPPRTDNPYMPIKRDRRRRLQDRAPDVGRPRHDDRRSWTPASTWTTRRCRRPPPVRARSSTGSPRPTRPTDRRPHLAGDADQVTRPPTFAYARRDLDARRRGQLPHPPLRRARPAPRAARSAATSTATATPPAAAASSGSSGTPARTTCWVDTDQDRDFTDDQAMTATGQRYDIGHFGTDDPAHRRRVRRMPFVVADRRQDEVRQHRHRLRRTRLPRGRHHRRERHVRRRR